MRKQIEILIIFNFLFAFSVLGQGENKFVGLSFGTAIPKTDLEPEYSQPGFQISAFMHFNKNRWLNVGFWISGGEIQAENRQVRFFDQSEFKINDFARTTYQSIHIEPSIHFIKKSNYSIYLSQGFGFSRFTVFDENNFDLANQLDSRSQGEEYANFSLILPTTLNAYYFLENGFGFQLRTGFINPQTDYLDNISAFGNPDNNDNIFILQLSILKQLNFKISKNED
ncbi:hypothetical protein QYS48_31835 [Marivirga arenosa]|uniref:Outer membrane protein beta-barrel domain-containing protein n=1 Tax=Marivirga arenosa TaxID=3059076 RepID=A0AA51R9V4_9BACT|nr:hypothetical protein [Marivirga sp. ABR2-2]WMN06173.1 hypothetical protein QYS48_31835 [Marivirga sp. ABR2-2]